MSFTKKQVKAIIDTLESKGCIDITFASENVEYKKEKGGKVFTLSNESLKKAFDLVS